MEKANLSTIKKNNSKQFLPPNIALQRHLKENFSLKRLTMTKKIQEMNDCRTVNQKGEKPTP